MNLNRTFAHDVCASPPKTGIDKVWLTLQDFSIRDGSRSGLTVWPASVDLAKNEDRNVTLFTDEAGKRFRGSKAAANSDLYSLDINSKGLRISFNPSKPYHPYELCSDEETFSERLENVFRAVSDTHGIRANFHKAKVSRLDLTRNTFTRHHFQTYLPILAGLNFARSKQQALYPDGYEVRNNTFGCIFYNKGQEAGTGHHNLMRAEEQFKKAKGKFARDLNVYSAADILEVGFSHLNDRYVNLMRNEIFKTDTFSGQVRLSFADVVTELNIYLELYGKQALNMLLLNNGIEPILEKVGGVGGFIELLRYKGFHRNTVSKYQKKINRLLSLRHQMNESATISKLYRELWTAFAA